MSGSQILLGVGIVVILHSAYSCLHYRELLRDLEETTDDMEYPLPPLDVWIEVVGGALTILASELVRSGSSLQPITTKQGSGGGKPRPMVAPAYQTRDFDIYTTRARSLY
mmetsp:Transcript_10321/g.28494  ORF Transcript_10321/g.28494 Transcript_10321/m.28494 type:complete len:110 (+) Transcript_10321:68-397(+)